MLLDSWSHACHCVMIPRMLVTWGMTGPSVWLCRHIGGPLLTVMLSNLCLHVISVRKAMKSWADMVSTFGCTWLLKCLSRTVLFLTQCAKAHILATAAPHGSKACCCCKTGHRSATCQRVAQLHAKPKSLARYICLASPSFGACSSAVDLKIIELLVQRLRH